MATFSDVGKDVNDQFTKDIAKEQNVELSAKINNYFSFLLKGNIKSGGKVDGTFAPTIKVSDYNVEVKPELTTEDSKGKTYKVEVAANDAFTVKGLKVELGTSNGKEGEAFLGAVYKNAKFGGVTGRISIPEGKDKYFTPSIFIETPETKGFGIGATAKVVLGNSASVETYKALASYKQGEWSGFAGVDFKVDKTPAPAVKVVPAGDKKVVPVAIEKKSVEPASADDSAKKVAEKPEAKKEEKPKDPSLFIVGGFLKKHDTNKTFGFNGSYNTENGAVVAELLFRKNYEDGTFLKLRGNLDGNVGVSKQFKPQPGVTVTLGTNVGIFDGLGNAGFQLSTDL